MKQVAALAILFALASCNTYQAARGNTAGTKIADGVKQDAAEMGKAIEQAAGAVGDAVNKALK